MREIYLASSALAEEPDPDKFDGVLTIDNALENGFDGVQLFLDSRYRDGDYIQAVVEKVRYSDLGVIIHLPNVVEEDDKVAAQQLSELLPEARFLIHYEPTTRTPDLTEIQIGWENSRIGTLDDNMRGHIDATLNKVVNEHSFFVFDFGRFMYLDNEQSDKEVIVNYIRDKIGKLDPDKDIIHLTDKKSWVLRFRECACVVGDGICEELLPDILAYDGIIVLEHENLQQAIDSLEVLKL